MSKIVDEELLYLAALAFAYVPLADLFRTACSSRYFQQASLMPKAWQYFIFTARRQVLDLSAQEMQLQAETNMFILCVSKLDTLTSKMRRVGELHNLAFVPETSNSGFPKRTRSPLHLRRFTCRDKDHWCLCYNTEEFGWFDKEHATQFATGLKIWAPCPLMCRWFSQPQGRGCFSDIAGRSVLELGAGVGLLGICVAARAKHVYITDRDDMLLRIASANARINHVSNATIARLPYGRHDALRFRETYGRMDQIIGADIVYSTSAVQPLFESVDVLLTDQGVFTLGFVRRDDRFVAEIYAAAQQFGMEQTWEPSFLAEALGESVRHKVPDAQTGMQGMLADFQKLLASIPLRSPCTE